MSTDYTAFDAALLAHIQDGRNKADALYRQNDLKELAEPHRGPARWEPEGKVPAWRIVDRRCQALRKKGAIRFIRRDHT